MFLSSIHIVSFMFLSSIHIVSFIFLPFASRCFQCMTIVDNNATLGIILHGLFTSNKEIRLLANRNSRPPEAAYLKNKPRLVPVCWQAFSSPPVSPFSSRLASLTDSFSRLCRSFLPSRLTRTPSYAGY